MTTVNDWNDQIITEFRANEGRVGGPFQGAPMLLLHHTGAKSGRTRVNPLMYLADGDRRRRRNRLRSDGYVARPWPGQIVLDREPDGGAGSLSQVDPG